jgi:hypothetical protein
MSETGRSSSTCYAEALVPARVETDSSSRAFVVSWGWTANGSVSSCLPQVARLPRVSSPIEALVMSDTTLDGLLSRLSGQDGQPNLKGIANALAVVAKREGSGNLLRNNLQNGSDPLQTIPPAVMTLQFLFILFVSWPRL